MPSQLKKAISKDHKRVYKKANTIHHSRRPFWLPASSYYFLVVAIVLVVFFLIWGILHEGGDETPWIPAGILSGLILIGAVFLREVFLRKARNRHIAAQRQLDYQLSQIPKKNTQKQKRQKFTLQQNEFMLNQIKEKSDAARVLKRLPAGHLEVFEICNEYLNFTKKELHWIDKNSPRYLAVRKGRKKVKKAHQYHLLKWAEVETTKYTREAKNKGTVVDKVESAQKALTVLDAALKFYPQDSNLLESAQAVNEYISTVKIKNRIENAEKTAFNGNYQESLMQYNDILFFLTRENLNNDDRQFLINKVEFEIEQIQKAVNDDQISINDLTNLLGNK